MKVSATIILFALVLLSACMGQSGTQQETAVDKHHNKLDDIKTAAEIEDRLTLIDTDYASFKVDDSLKYLSRFNKDDGQKAHDLAFQLKVEPWVKADFDENGYTDLLVVGKWYDHSVLVILDSGENKFYIKHLTRHSFQENTYPVVIDLENKKAILNHYMDREFRNGRTEEVLKTDTLVFRFGDFVEYHAKPAEHKIEKIEYVTGPCFGTCPIFSIKITSDRKASYSGSNYNYPDGDYTGTIDSAHYYTLTGLLNYIHFTGLDSAYAVGWTDDQDCTLLVTYDGGKVKRIDDYGLLGTFGLNRVYDILFNLRDDQKWYDKDGKLKVPDKSGRRRF